MKRRDAKRLEAKYWDSFTNESRRSERKRLIVTCTNDSKPPFSSSLPCRGSVCVKNEWGRSHKECVQQKVERMSAALSIRSHSDQFHHLQERRWAFTRIVLCILPFSICQVGRFGAMVVVVVMIEAASISSKERKDQGRTSSILLPRQLIAHILGRRLGGGPIITVRAIARLSFVE